MTASSARSGTASSRASLAPVRRLPNREVVLTGLPALAGAGSQVVQVDRAASLPPITTVTRSTGPACAAPPSPSASARAVATAT